MAADKDLEAHAGTYCCMLGCSWKAGSTPVIVACAIKRSRMPSGRGADQMYSLLRSCNSAKDSLHGADKIADCPLEHEHFWSFTSVSLHCQWVSKRRTSRNAGFCSRSTATKPDLVQRKCTLSILMLLQVACVYEDNPQSLMK